MAKCKNCVNLMDVCVKSNNGHEEEFQWCSVKDGCPDIEIERDCDEYESMTNADRIRSMTDEELTKWMCGFNTCIIPFEPDSEAYCTGEHCEECILKWLKSEVEEIDMNDIKTKLNELQDIIYDYDELLGRACSNGIYSGDEYENMDTMRNRAIEIIEQLMV